MGMTVELGDLFSNEFNNFPVHDQHKIVDFILHVQNHGLTGLTGKIARSTNIPVHDRDYHTKYQYARDHYLWHYHIGIPSYEAPRNPMASYFTSDYVLHFQRFPGERVIRIVDLGCHDPMRLPSPSYLSRGLQAP